MAVSLYGIIYLNQCHMATSRSPCLPGYKTGVPSYDGNVESHSTLL
jgi:hypothetical protein